MLQTYFKIACRHIMKGKTFALINIVGLSVGITSFFLIVQYVSFELSYDQFHKNKDEIYRVAYAQNENGELKNKSAQNFIGIPKLIKDHFPEVKASTGFGRTSSYAGFLFSYLNKLYYEPEPFYQTDSSFFSVFPSLLLKGDPSSVLKDPHDLVISEKMAKKLFGNIDPIGKRIENKSPSYADVSDFLVTGVMKDMAENSHFHMNFAALIHKSEVTIPNYWNGPKLYTYLTVRSETDPNRIAGRLNLLIRNLEKENPKTKGTQVFLQPISDIHLHSDLHDELENNGSEILVYILSAIGIIILVLAWINYVNLETGRFITRTKEVGIRRIIGSGKSDLALQFLVEYFCIAMLAACVAFISLQLIRLHFSDLTGVPSSNIQWSAAWTWFVAFGIFLAGSIVAGVYPALFLLKLNPIAALKGSFGGPNHGGLIRKSLIVIQFTSVLVLLAIVLVIQQQLDYMRITNKKIDVETVVSVRNPTVYANEDDSINYIDYKAFENNIEENSMIKNVTSSSAIPGMEIDETFVNRMKLNRSDPDNPTRYKILFVDYNFIPFYGIKLKAGRNYSRERGDEENWNTVILNEAAIHALGFSSAQEAIDQEIDFLLWGGKFEKYKIVGIVEDYHHEAIKKAIQPTILSLNHGRFQDVFYSIKLKQGSDPQEALSSIERSWKEVFPNKSFDYFFLDEYYDRQFKSEVHFGGVFGLFAVASVFIACLGILGMTLFEANSRLKEISIRKVLGATVSNLLTLLSKDYFKVIFAATIISNPLIYFIASEWLNNYPSRIEISAWFLILPVITILLLVISVSGFQTIKAANVNPVDNLKYE